MKRLPERGEMEAAIKYLKYEDPEVAAFLRDVVDGYWTLVPPAGVAHWDEIRREYNRLVADPQIARFPPA